MTPQEFLQGCRFLRDDCRHLRLDSNETIFFSRQLEAIKPQTYDVLYAELSAFTVFPLSTGAGIGAETITYRSFDQVGEARIISSKADDLPQVGVKGKEVTTNVRSVGASYEYTRNDIRAAMMANRNLSADLARAAVRAHNQKINDIAWFGDTEHGLDGFQDNTDIPTAAAATGAWASATAEQMVDDVNPLLIEILETSKGVHQPNFVALPPDKLARLATKRLSNTNVTALTFLEQNWPRVQFVMATELTDWDGASTDAIIAGQRDSMTAELEIPMPYTEYPVQEVGLKLQIPTESRVGGLVVRYPKAFNIKTGI